MKVFKIAIDGPAAAGKSTVAKEVAQLLNFTYIDTGAMYRALTLKASQANIPFTDEKCLVNLFLQTSLTFKQANKEQRIIVDGSDVTEEIRQPEVTKHVSTVAKHKRVRELMVKHQQQLAKNNCVVMDGRDIGTHVLPDAEVKIFLVASVEERAKRRYEENLKRGFKSDLNYIKQEVMMRDLEDENRTISPLVKAKDAIEINTTHLTIDQVVQKIIDIVKRKLALKND